jgi:hypothetical protein
VYVCSLELRFLLGRSKLPRFGRALADEVEIEIREERIGVCSGTPLAVCDAAGVGLHAVIFEVVADFQRAPIRLREEDGSAAPAVTGARTNASVGECSCPSSAS